MLGNQLKKNLLNLFALFRNILNQAVTIKIKTLGLAEGKKMKPVFTCLHETVSHGI